IRRRRTFMKVIFKEDGNRCQQAWWGCAAGRSRGGRFGRGAGPAGNLKHSLEASRFVARRRNEESTVAADKIDTIVSLSKRRGFVFPCSEIYGGQRAAWDYGPLGVELKENLKRQWWRYMVTSREDVVGI